MQATNPSQPLRALMYMSMIFFSDGGGDSARGGDCVYVHETATEKLAAARLGIDPEQPPEGSNTL
jgi:hypothetical protein